MEALSSNETNAADQGLYVWSALLVSALIGFSVSAFLFPMWTDNVESAQVLAGLVRLPADNPIRYFHLSAITALSDSAALLLKLGIPEWQLSVFYSGLQGALACAAVTACTLVVARNVATALLVPIALLQLRIYLMQVDNRIPGFWPAFGLRTFHGHGYPVLFPSHTVIFGTVGLFGAIFVWSLFALRQDRSAALCAGLLPWLHVMMGLACWLGAAVAFWRCRDDFQTGWRKMLPWFGLGLLVTVCGMAAHKIIFYAAVHTPVAISREAMLRYAISYAKYWDGHRVFTLNEILRMLEVDLYVLLLLGALYLFARAGVSTGVRFLTCCLLTMTAIGCTYLAWYVLSPDTLPFLLQQLMLQRLLNLNSIIYPALVFGLLGYLGFGRKNPVALGVLTLLAGLTLSLTLHAMTFFGYIGTGRLAGYTWLEILGYLLFPLLGVGETLLLLAFQDRMETAAWYAAYKANAHRQASAACILLLATMSICCSVTHAASIYDSKAARGEDAFTPLMHRLAQGKGLFTIFPKYFVRPQLRTRRGVLLDPWLINGLPYLPEIGPAMEDILNRVYGASLLNRPTRAVPDFWSKTRRLWERRSRAEWQAIRREYGVTNAVVPADLRLQLPLSYRSEFGAIYDIPAPGGRR